MIDDDLEPICGDSEPPIEEAGKPKARRKLSRPVKRFLSVLLLLYAAFHAWARLRPQPPSLTRELWPGATYIRESTRTPHPMVIHIVKIDLRRPEFEFFVSPGDPNAKLPLKGSNTSDFLRKYGLNLAINADFFYPWRSVHLLSYYPHVGDPVSVQGFAMSNGVTYQTKHPRQPPPTLNISRTNKVWIGAPTAETFNAVSGMWLVGHGKSAWVHNPTVDRDYNPRVAVGVSQDGNMLIIGIVDGRQPNVSEGISLPSLADLMIMQGAYQALNLDGGGSAILAIKPPNGHEEVLNCPIDCGIPYRERVVANQLGMRVRQ
jgi:hypothetical protein